MSLWLNLHYESESQYQQTWHSTSSSSFQPLQGAPITHHAFSKQEIRDVHLDIQMEDHIQCSGNQRVAKPDCIESFDIRMSTKYLVLKYFSSGWI